LNGPCITTRAVLCIPLYFNGSGIAQSLQREIKFWAFLGSIPDKSRNFCLLHGVEIVSGTLSASYPIGTGVISLRVKRPSLDAKHSPSIANVFNS
jgi:hypothetical protein